MTLKPEIRGLWQMASRYHDAGQYDAALQYFSLALRKYIRDRAQRHCHLLSDPFVLILSLNSCVVLCHMRNFTDAFALLKLTCLSSLAANNLLAVLPEQFVPLVLKILAVIYFNHGTTDTNTVATRYLSLIRNGFFQFFSRHMSSHEAALLFLMEAQMNSSCDTYESMNAFHVAFRLLISENELNKTTSTKLSPYFSTLVLKLCGESSRLACSLTKEQLTLSRSFMNPLDFTCLLCILGSSHMINGEALLAVEVLEKCLSFLNTEDIQSLIQKNSEDHHLQLYFNSCVSTNLSIAYHMLDVKRTYRCNWENLSSRSLAMLENNFDTYDNPSVPPVFCMVRYLCLFNRCAHSSLSADYKAAYRDFSTLYTEELGKVIERCGNIASFCGISYIPDLNLELLEIIAMLLAAIGDFDESWRTFLICFDEVATAAEKVSDENVKKDYLSCCYSRIADKMGRCLPPSKNKKAYSEIGRLRLQAPTTDVPISLTSSAASFSVPDERRKVGDVTIKKTVQTPIEDDETLVAEEFKNALQLEDSPRPVRKEKKRKKRRPLIQQVLLPKPPTSKSRSDRKQRPRFLEGKLLRALLQSS